MSAGGAARGGPDLSDVDCGLREGVTGRALCGLVEVDGEEETDCCVVTAADGCAPIC